MSTSSTGHHRLVSQAFVALSSMALLAACTSSGSQNGNHASAVKLVSSLPAASGSVDQITWNLTGGEPDTIDPPNAADYSSGTVVSNMCDSLLKMDANYNLEPNLASYKWASPTQMVLTVRQGATFWDGKPVTAEDVAWSLNRSMQPNKIVSFGFINVKSINVTGQNEVTIDFKQPDELFAREMANISSVVMEKDASEKLGDKLGTPQGGVMCSGPYEFKSWSPGNDIILTRNPNYWNPERAGFAQEVKFVWVTDTAALVEALDAGEIDGAYQIPPSVIPRLQSSTSGRVVLGPSVETMALWVARPGGPLQDIDLRTALQNVIDRQALADTVYHGSASPAYALISPTNWPNQTKDLFAAAYQPFVKERAFDLNKAKSLVKQSSYDGTPLVLAYLAGDETQSLLAQLVQQQAGAAGINVKLMSMPPLLYTQAGYEASKRQGVDLMLSPNFNGAIDPNELAGFEFLPGEDFYNYTKYDNPKVTKLLMASRSELDPTKSAEDFIKAQAIYEQASTTITLLQTDTVTFLNNHLTGAITSFAYWSMPSMAFIGAASPGPGGASPTAGSS